MGVREIDRSLEQWQMGVKDLRRRMILAPTPRERERWYTILLLAQGWTAAATAEALARDPHGPAHHRTLGVSLRRRRTCGPDIRADRWFPPALDQAQQEKLKEAVEQPPATSGIGLANWYWKVVRRFALERFGIELSRSSCLNYLHRLGFAFKRPKKRLLKADAAKREAFVAAYAALREEAQQTRARIFFADEAHFRADAELRGKWVLKGRPALVDSTSPRYGEKASYYSAVCLETGEVEWMELEGNSNSGTSVDFLKQLRGKHPGPLRVIWDNAPAHRGEAVREYLRTPGLELRLVNLPGYSPDFNADEAIWGWAREEATGNLCLGSKVKVSERVGNFLAGLASRRNEVRRRCRTVLQSRAEALLPNSQHDSSPQPESTEGGGRDGGAGYKGPRGATVPVDFGSLASVNGLRWSC